MFYPLLDIQNWSDNKLKDTLTKVQQYKDHSDRYGHTTMSHDLDVYMDALIAEYDRRLIILSSEKQQKDMEMDANLKRRYSLDPINLGEIEGEENNNNDK
jgi:hypothetical protein